MKKRHKLFLISLLVFPVIIIFSAPLFLKAKHRPNIILITLDAVRSDHLSCYGYKRFTTPNIDNLAKEGTIFLQAIAPGTETSYSLPVILTSNFFHSHGAREWRDTFINSSAKTLAEILLDNGYNTGFFFNAYPIILIRGINRGFGTFVYVKEKNAAKLTNTVLDWLKLNRAKRFFLWIHYFDTHYPYSPPSPYDTLYLKDKFNIDDKNIPIGSPNDIWVGLNVIPYAVARNNITSVNYYISQYDGEIRFADEQIGVLLDSLKKLRLAKNTLIIVSSDHGESLGEHSRYFQHGGIPFEVLLRVPLIFKYDPLIPKNKTIEEQVSTADIVPTLLDILNIKYPDSVGGESFLGLLKNKKGSYDAYAFSKCASSIYCLRTKDWKLVYFTNSDKYVLNDLENDKGELMQDEKRNIKREEAALLRTKINEWVEKDKKKGMILQKMPPFDKGTIEKLKSLGYLQGD